MIFFHSEVLCKPKIIPIKSITLEKLEEMEKNAAAVGKSVAEAGISRDNPEE